MKRAEHKEVMHKTEYMYQRSLLSRKMKFFGHQMRADGLEISWAEKAA